MKMTKKAALEYAINTLWVTCYGCWEAQNEGNEEKVKCKVADCELKAVILKLDKERSLSWTKE